MFSAFRAGLSRVKPSFNQPASYFRFGATQQNLRSKSTFHEGVVSTPIYPDNDSFPQLTLEAEDLSSTALIAEQAGLTFFGSGYTILLYGDIGAGKTTFARYFIGSFLDEENPNVSSPTFTLDTTYTHPLNGVKLHHMDLYRIEKEKELDVLNLPEIYSNSISLIEWPDRLHKTKYMPSSYVVVHLMMDDLKVIDGDAPTLGHLHTHADGTQCMRDHSKDIKAPASGIHYHDGVACTGHHSHDEEITTFELDGEPRVIHISCVNMGVHGRTLIRQLTNRIQRSQEEYDE